MSIQFRLPPPQACHMREESMYICRKDFIPIINSPCIPTELPNYQLCTASAPAPAGAYVAQTFSNYYGAVYGVYYMCYYSHMNSGYPGQLTQCVAGSWTSINDYCVSGKNGSCSWR